MWQIRLLRHKLKQSADANPHRVWRRLLISFFVLVIFVLAGGYFLYRYLDTIELVSQHRLQNQENQALNLDLNTLNLVEDWLATKARRFGAASSPSHTLSDPAL